MNFAGGCSHASWKLQNTKLAHLPGLCVKAAATFRFDRPSINAMFLDLVLDRFCGPQGVLCVAAASFVFETLSWML